MSVLGHDPAKRERSLRQRVGIVLQSTGIDPFLTVRETIDMYAGYYPTRRPADEVTRSSSTIVAGRTDVAISGWMADMVCSLFVTAL